MAPEGDYRHDAFRDDVVRVVEDIGRAPAIVGASLGGIAGLIASGESGDGFARALVLVDIAPRMEPKGVSRISALMRAHPDGFASLDEAADARVPVLLVRGRMSDILSEAGAAEFRQLVPHADYVDVRDVGHMVAGDRNDVFTEAVASFLARELPPIGGS